MNHDDAVRLMAVESYLLGELSPVDRDEFEVHFFDCRDCALELKLTAAFLDEAKAELANAAKPAAATQTRPAKASQPANAPAAAKGSIPAPLQAPLAADAPSPPSPARAPARRASTSPFAFLWRPALLSPAVALALIVLVYQNAVVLPRDADEIARLKNPSIPAALSFVGGNSRAGGPIPKVEVAKDQAFMLSLDIATEGGLARYACELRDPGGAVVWRAPVTADQAKDTVQIYVPAANWANGEYRLVVLGYAEGGDKQPGDAQPVKITAYPFALAGRVGPP